MPFNSAIPLHDEYLQRDWDFQHMPRIWPVRLPTLDPLDYLLGCIGTSRSGRRLTSCTRNLPFYNRHLAFRLREEALDSDAPPNELGETMQKLAHLCICNEHHDEALWYAYRWIGEISVARREKRLGITRSSAYSYDPRTGSRTSKEEGDGDGEGDDTRERYDEVVRRRGLRDLDPRLERRTAEIMDHEHHYRSPTYGESALTVPSFPPPSQVLAPSLRPSVSVPDFPPCNHPRAVRRTLIGEQCRICIGLLRPHEELVWCKANCGHNFHQSCIFQLEKFQAQPCGHGEWLHCPLCRNPWHWDPCNCDNPAPQPAVGRADRPFHLPTFTLPDRSIGTQGPTRSTPSRRGTQDPPPSTPFHRGR